MRPFKKTRILYINQTGLVSGAEKVLMSILSGLDRTRFEPYVLCPAQGRLAGEVLVLGVEWLPLPPIQARFAWRPDRIIHSVFSLLKAVMTIRKQIRKVAPDFIHANSVRAGIPASVAAMSRGIPVIWHVHDSLPRHPVSSAIRLFLCLARRTRVIAVSNATAKRVIGILPIGKRVQTIYNAVDLSRFSAKQTKSSEFRKTIGVSGEDFLVCAIGQICARKGLLESIYALRHIVPQAPHIHLAIVGKVVFRHEEEYLDALRSTSRVLGIEDHIHFTGELYDVSPVLQASDLLVLNSRDEPFGLVLIEAMACGTPVLATRVGGIPEIVTDSENGWLIESGDTAALASTLLELSRNAAALVRVADRARRVTCPRFSLNRFQCELAKLYAELDPYSDLNWNVPNRRALARSGNNQGVSHA